MSRVPIGAVSDFPAGKIHGVEVEGRPLVVINLDGTLHVLDGICTHAYAELRTGFLLGDSFRCPLHLSQFDVRTGKALGPPAEEPLQTYPVEVEGDQVFIELE